LPEGLSDLDATDPSGEREGVADDRRFDSWVEDDRRFDSWKRYRPLPVLEFDRFDV